VTRAAEHDTKLSWAAVFVALPEPSGWTAQVTGGVVTSLGGRCPRCHGDNAGRPLSHLPEALTGAAVTNVVGEPPPAPPPAPAVAVYVECRCGYDHGKAGATGCGWGGVVVCQDGTVRNSGADPADLSAQRELEQQYLDRLPEIRARAGRWIAALTALVGLVASAAVLKGPDDLTKVREQPFWWGAVLGLIGLAAVIAGIACAYVAAYGPLRGSGIDKLARGAAADRTGAQLGGIDGLAARYEQSVSADTAAGQQWLVAAACSALAGIVLLVAGAAVLALGVDRGSGKSDNGPALCVKAGTATVHLPNPPDIGAGTVTFVPCPPASK
jgi:hypothetical protein